MSVPGGVRPRPTAGGIRRRPACARLALAGLLAGLAAGAAGDPGREEIRYRWRLSNNLAGVLAGLFFPDAGDGRLTVDPLPDGTVRNELLITSEQGGKGEYFRYGSLADAASGRALSAWSSYSWRGEEKHKQGEIDELEVVDIAAAIFLLRRDPPGRPRRLEIWSDGRTYPVVVIPLGEELRAVGGRQVPTRHYSVRGVAESGKRLWKGRLDLWLADGPEATPVAIRVERRRLAVLLEQQPP